MNTIIFCLGVFALLLITAIILSVIYVIVAVKVREYKFNKMMRK